MSGKAQANRGSKVQSIIYSVKTAAEGVNWLTLYCKTVKKGNSGKMCHIIG